MRKRKIFAVVLISCAVFQTLYAWDSGANQDILTPSTSIDKLSEDDFFYALEIASKMWGFSGLSGVVRQNPKQTRAFILFALKNNQIKVGSNYYNLLCKMGLFYRNFFHDSRLLDEINNTLGGVGNFLKNESSSKGVLIAPRSEALTPLDHIMSKVDITENLLMNLKYHEAAVLLKREVVISNILLEGSVIYSGDGIYPDIVLFYALTEFRNGNFAIGRAALDELLSRGYESYVYAQFLLGSEKAIIENKSLVDQVFLKFKKKKKRIFSFDEYMKELTGFSYSDLAWDYTTVIRSLAKNRKIRSAYSLTAKLLAEFEKRKNMIINFNYSKKSVKKLRMLLYSKIIQESKKAWK